MIDVNRKMRPLLFLLIFISTSACIAQSGSFSKIDSFAASCRDTFPDDTTLVNYLTGSYDDDISRVRAMFYWVIDNVSYDESLLEVDRIYSFESQPDYVLSKKTAICTGFATLFAHMCSLAGIECYVVGGYVHGEYTLEDVYIYSTHSWNVIKIGDTWKHIDPTWDAYAHRHRNDSLEFLMDFEKLVESRLPENPMWQFREEPFSFKSFDPGCSQATVYNRNWNYKDSIQKYTQLGSFNRRLFEARHTFEYNPYNRFTYGSRLADKADSISFDYSNNHGEHGWVLQQEKERELLYEALKMLNPNMPIYLENDKVTFYRSKWVRKKRRGVKSQIKRIEKKNRSMPYYDHK